jgi:hypothetical protein
MLIEKRPLQLSFHRRKYIKSLRGGYGGWRMITTYAQFHQLGIHVTEDF